MNSRSARMPRCELLAVTTLMIAGWSCHAVSAQCFVQLPPTVDDIADLADESFQVRQQARGRLLDRGTEACDWLLLARYSSDQEIGRSSQRLLQQIDFGEALAQLDRSLAGFRQLDFAGRAKLIIRLGRSSNTESQIALTLIARFEDDEVLSRSAAVELIEGEPRDVAAVAQSLSSSMRTASRWIRAWTRSRTRPDELHKIWHPLIERLLNDPGARQFPDSTCRLLKWYSGQLLDVGDAAESDRITNQYIHFLDARPMDVTEVFDWLLMHRRFAACNELMGRFSELMENEPRLLFRRAELLRMQGDEVGATGLARQAAAAVGTEPLLQLQSAINLQYSGLNYWAHWQLDRVIKDKHAPPTVVIQACQFMAEMQYTENRFRDAAMTLQTAIDTRPVPGEPAVSLLQDEHGSCEARRSYFLHLDALAQDAVEEAGQHLLNGIAACPDNSDLLIAMSRFRDADQQWIDTTRELIELALADRQESIHQLLLANEEDPRQNRLREVQLAQEMNGYAWLACQSGFDLAEAEKHARQAAALAPCNSMILDTLASCLYRTGKYRDAVAVQQQAIRHNPNSLQLRAGLSQYQQAMLLAELPNFIR